MRGDAGASGIELTADFLDRAAALVGRRAGLAFDVNRRATLAAGVRSGMDRCGTQVPEQYLTRLDHEPTVLDELLADVTVSETYFFRDSDQFALLREVIVPSLLSRRSDGRPLRLWSAGCASGEEPYSLAILLHQLGQLRGAKILGTDVSRPALHLARQARYTNWSLRGVSDDIVRTYFTQAGGRCTPAVPFREAVEFGYLNLAEPGYPSVGSGVWAMDVILCRNVLLYFAPSRVAEVAERLAATLADDGWLLLGSTDPILSDVPGLAVEVTSAGLAYRRTRRGGVGQARSVESSVESMERRSGPSEGADVATASPSVPSQASSEWQGASPSLGAPLEAEPPADAAYWTSQIKALVNSGDLPSAEAACRAAREQLGMSAELAIVQALVLLEAGSHDEAGVAARQALYLDPELPMAHLALGTALVRSRDIVGARRAFKNAERLLNAMPADTLVAAGDDEPAGRLAELAQTQLAFLDTDKAQAP